ncbi:hypothetical protein NA56DRAFT_710035 [Hyaloscypha hepaticicola]|uniref:Helitron helicase-like domain-containing protein n=1 Tax=Hyaloscypha hepaticicola TaxID=2082293 RepID=A0A2J6PMV5_9HELO|nr:hypothetical protein NA56DRAFT_710035 [Hyaloscypha hepaticicola]
MAISEINRELKKYNGLQPTDRPDLITRVFHLKVQELFKDVKNDLFGLYTGHVYSIEY